jgi:Fe-S cluster biogenesis protein NfuA/NifU-like protein involved in Fe-S cluster formation
METSVQDVTHGFSERFTSAGMNPKNRGAYFGDEAAANGLVLVEAKSRDIKIYWLVEPETGLIHASKFFAYGGTESNAIADKLCDLAKGEPLTRVLELTGEDVERILRDTPVVSAVPEEKRDEFIVVDELLRAVKEEWPKALAKAQAVGIVKAGLKRNKGALRFDLDEKEEKWLALPKDEQIQKVEAALDGPVRDYLQSEGGDMIVRDIEGGRRVIVEYVGSCGSCASSTGMTLAFIEDTLRSNLYEGLSVIPY